MSSFDFNTLFSNGLDIRGSGKADLIFGSFGNDTIAGKGGDDLIFGLFGDDTITGGTGDDQIFGDHGNDDVSGGDGEDQLYGGFGDDRVTGNKGDDQMFGGFGDDLLVWNNGDGSDLMVGGQGYDRVQVNFDTDLVNDDLQNKDVAEFSVTGQGVQFARTEVNDQSEFGLFQLDIRETEALETNFGGGDDTAVIKGDVLGEIKLDLDGGAGTDTLDLSQAAEAAKVILGKGKLNDSKAVNFENAIGTGFDDVVRGTGGDNTLSGQDGEDRLWGNGGDDTLIGNKGNDAMYGGKGKDEMIWNNGDGSDLMNGGKGKDVVQVNFDTDLVNDDLQNKDVAEFSVTGQGVEFARVELNDQSEAGLFQLDIRNTEKLETNFGGGDDAAVIKGDVLNEIKLDLDGGDGVDLIDLGQATGGVSVDLEAGKLGSSKAVNFENVTGTAYDDTITGDSGNNVIRGGAGNDVMQGGEGADTFVFFEEDLGVDVILDFEIGVDSLVFATTDPSVTADSLVGALSQTGDDVELAFNNKVISFEDTTVSDFTTDDFMIA